MVDQARCLASLFNQPANCKVLILVGNYAHLARLAYLKNTDWIATNLYTHSHDPLRVNILPLKIPLFFLIPLVGHVFYFNHKIKTFFVVKFCTYIHGSQSRNPTHTENMYVYWPDWMNSNESGCNVIFIQPAGLCLVHVSFTEQKMFLTRQ